LKTGAVARLRSIPATSYLGRKPIPTASDRGDLESPERHARWNQTVTKPRRGMKLHARPQRAFMAISQTRFATIRADDRLRVGERHAKPGARWKLMALGRPRLETSGSDRARGNSSLPATRNVRVPVLNRPAMKHEHNSKTWGVQRQYLSVKKFDPPNPGTLGAAARRADASCGEMLRDGTSRAAGNRVPAGRSTARRPHGKRTPALRLL